jgi:hypothetical protein
VLDEPLVSPKITLPNLEWISIFGNQYLFDAFDFRDNEALDFKAGAWQETLASIQLSCLPVQTTSISLSNFKWTQKPIQPHRFVELTDLDLEKVGIRGTLGDHLVLPNLKHPNLVKVFFKELKDNKLVNQPFSDKAFLEGAPMLETIALSGMPIGDSFIEGLKSCASLRHLHLEQCKTDLLAIGLQDYLLDNELLPSLETLKIINSWPDKDYMYFDILRWCFPKKRPDVIFSTMSFMGSGPLDDDDDYW